MAVIALGAATALMRVSIAVELDLLHLRVAFGPFGPEVPLYDMDVHLFVEEVLPVTHRDVEERFEQVGRGVDLANAPSVVRVEFGNRLEQLVCVRLVCLQCTDLNVSRQRGQPGR